MNIITARRMQTFWSNTPARIALYMFLCAFCVSLLAELIANERPLLVWSNSTLYAPAIRAVTEKDLGGDLDIQADFHDPFILGIVQKNGGWLLWAPIRYSYNTISTSPDAVFPAPPGQGHLLGTDDQGRDVLARLVYGFRLSVLFGLCLALCTSVVGILAGAVQGYYGGWVDLIFQRIMEIWGGIPVLYLLIIAASMVRMTFWLLLGVMLFFGWMRLVGVVRMETLRARNLEYVTAARALGVSELRIMLRHVLPNALVAVLSKLPFQVNASIVTLTSLDFLGFGLPPGYPSLGELAAQGKNNLHASWIGISVFMTTAGMLACLVLIGEGIRDAFDPRIFLHQEAKQMKGDA